MSELSSSKIYKDISPDATGTDSEVYFKSGEAEKLYNKKVFIERPEIVWTYVEIVNKTQKLGPWNLGKSKITQGDGSWDITMSVNPVYSTFFTEKDGQKIPSSSSPQVNGINYLHLRTQKDISADLERLRQLQVPKEELVRLKKIHSELMQNPAALADIVDNGKAKIKRVGKKFLHLDPFFFQDVNCMITSPSQNKVQLVITDLGMSIKDISKQILKPS